MKTMVISEFKAKCISTLKEAQRSGEDLLITWRGHPLARVKPISDSVPPRKLGALRGRLRIRGDLIHTGFNEDWEMAR